MAALELAEQFFCEASPEIQKKMKSFVSALERAAKKTPNLWDDALVSVLKNIIVKGENRAKIG